MVAGAHYLFFASQDENKRDGSGGQEAADNKTRGFVASPRFDHGAGEGWVANCLHGCLLQKKKSTKERAGRLGLFAPDDDHGPGVRFSGYVLAKYTQTNNGSKLWAALEALLGFWVLKLQFRPTLSTCNKVPVVKPTIGNSRGVGQRRLGP